MGELGALSFWLFLAVIVAGSIALAVGMIKLADRTLSDSVGQKDNSALSPFLTCVALVFGALLGFTVVVAWEQFSSAEAHATHEASTLTTMYRQTVAMPAPEQAQLRRLLRQYADAVKGPEWDRQDEGGTSNTARAAITQMYRVLGSQQPNDASSQIKGEFLGQLTVLASDRNQRFLDTRPRIPGLLWSVCSSVPSWWWESAVSCAWTADMVTFCSRARSLCCSACCYSLSSGSTIRSGRSEV
jgi:hypothetical protein